MGRRSPVASAEPLLPAALKRGGRAARALERCASRPDDELQWFRSCLRWVFMDHSGPAGAALSWLLFLVLAVLVPAAAHFLLVFRDTGRPFSLVAQLSLSAASAAGFLCLSSAFRRVGLRRLLYLDKLRTKSDRVRLNYTARLAFSFRLLASLVAPCFAAEAAYKVWWYATSANSVPFFANDVLGDILACSLEMASWMYRSAIYLLTCVLFRLICHLQGLRLEDFAGSLLHEVEEGRIGVEHVLREHLDIRKQLKVISHRFRKFIVAALLIATASQFSAVLLTTRRDSVDDLLNTGELARKYLGRWASAIGAKTAVVGPPLVAWISMPYLMETTGNISFRIPSRQFKISVSEYHPGTRMQFQNLTQMPLCSDPNVSSLSLQLCLVVLVSGVIIILNSAAKITHQAQALTGHTTKWHACCTIEPVYDEEAATPVSNHNSVIEQDHANGSDTESSEETGDDEDLLENTKFMLPQAHVLSFQKRQALVTYLENNRAGITVFGFTLDRAHLHAIFMLEWTLFLWLLGKTVGFSSRWSFHSLLRGEE